MASNPWKTVKKNTLYQNKFGYTLRDDDVITPAGKPGKYMVLESQPYVSIVALTPKDEIILIRHWRYPIDQESLEIPAGGIELTESPLQAAMRELSEETGYSAKQWHQLSEYWIANGAIKCKAYVFLATEAVSDHTQHYEPTESITVEKMPFNTALEKTMLNEFAEDRSITSILLANEFLKSSNKKNQH